MKTFDFSGLECPGPVIETKKYMDQNSGTKEISIIVDNHAASENVSRFLSNSGFETSMEKGEKSFKITGIRGESFEKNEGTKEPKKEGSTLIMFTNITLGSGSPELGEKLMLNFIKTLFEMDNLWRLVFVNESVKLTVGEAQTIEALKNLEKKGVSILVCGTCLEYFDILKDKEVGETTNMLDIVTSLEVADKVINY